MELSGRTILVTGASSGIGEETCRCLAELGAKVVLVARDSDRLHKVLESMEGADHAIEKFDLAQLDSIPSWIKDVRNRLGPIHGMVHSAGALMIRGLQMWQEKECREIMGINVMAGLALARGFRQKGVSQPGGSLVLVSSVAGLVGQPALAEYAATKGAIVSATRSMALELAPQGLRVNCVAPGSVEGPMAERQKRFMPEQQQAALKARHALGLGRPRDVANAIAFLLGDAARWITGTTLVVDGGFSA